MKKYILAFTAISLLIAFSFSARAQVNCAVSKYHGRGYTSSIISVTDNGDNTHTIVLQVEHDGCPGPTCKELSYYAVEGIPGTYSGISVEIIEGNMSYGQISYGPNLGGCSFDGFKIDDCENIGDGEAGIFTVTYTLTGGLQNQQTMAKAGPHQMYVSFTIEEFESVLNCGVPTTIIPYYPPPEGGKILNSLIGPELTSLYETYIAYDSLVSNDIFRIVDDTNVVIELFALDGQFDALLSLLQTPAYGLTDVVVDPAQNRVSGVFPVINLLSLNSLVTQLNYARPVYPGIPQSGIVNTQGDTSLLGFIARNGFNVAGEGIKIGVLSDSYNTQIGNLAADDIIRGDLPGPGNPDNPVPVDLLEDYPYGVATDEGRAMMQIIHDIAPKAELAFRTGLKSAKDFANGIIQLQEAGCDIIVDDITYISEPFLSDGVVTQAVDSVVALGVSYFTAAGNFGSKSYEAAFNPASILPAGLTGTAHNFATSGPEDIYQSITVAPGNYTVVIQWDDGSGPSETNTDLDIYLAYDNGARLFGFNKDNTDGASIEVLPFTVTDTSQTNFLIVKASGSDPVSFKYIVFRGNIAINEYGNSGASTIVGQANSAGAMTVGAVLYSNTPAFGVNPPTIASFSSRGGISITGADRFKPDFTGPNGVNTTVDLGGFNLEGDLFPNFFGTSAAAPHIAGVAALLLEAKKKYYGADSTISPEQMRTILQSTAVDMDSPGFDNISGAGLVNAAAALATLATPSPLITEIIYDTSLIPGVDSIPISVVGQYLTSGSEIYFNGAPLETSSTVSGDTLVSSVIPPFDEYYPEIQVFNPPGGMTNGLDGGLSNPLYFTTKPTIVIDINDTTKKYAELIPQFTADYRVISPDTVTTLAGAWLTPAAIARIQGIPLVTVANDTSNVGLWPIAASLDDPLNPLSSLPATDPLDTALLAAFDFDIINGIMSIEKLDLLIVPRDTTIVFGDTLTGFDFDYIYNNDTINPGNNVAIGDSVNAAILNAVRQAHATALVNAVATVRATALVNASGEPLLDSTDLANSSFFITNAVYQKQATALVNGTLLNAVQLANALSSSSATALVNAVAMVRATALVNGLATVLVNGIATALVNTSSLVNGASLGSVGSSSATALVNTNTVNDSSNTDAVVILDEDDILILSGDSVGNVEIFSVSVITGNTAGQHWIIPGAFVSNNYNITYGLGKITILPDTAEVIFDTASLVQTYDGTPRGVSATTDPPGLDVGFTYNGDTIPPTDVGTYIVNAAVNDTNYVGWASASLIIVPDTAQVSFDTTTLTQVYDGAAKVVSATTAPEGLNLVYSFSSDPVNVDEYQVTATVDDPNYVGSATDTLLIKPATAMITFVPSSLSQVYDGSSKSASATTDPEGLSLIFTFDDDPVNVGNYLVTASIDASNYIGMVSDTLSIIPAVATVSFDPGSLTATYSGLPQTVTVSTIPAGLTVDITYDGYSTLPVDAEGYDVTATVIDENYIGNAMDIFTIQPATAYVTSDLKVIKAGQSLPYFTSTFSGFVNGEDESVVTSLNYSLSPSYNGYAGTYQIIPSATANNYVFVANNGQLYVNPYGWGAHNIEPEVVCVEQIPPDEQGLTYRATFAYENDNSTDVYISRGNDNGFICSGNFNDDELPELFVSGGGTFQVNFDGNDLKWKVKSYLKWWKVACYATARTSSPSCYNPTSAQAPEPASGSGKLGIETVNVISESRAYPNPVRDKLHIELTHEVNANDIFIYDVYGKLSPVQADRITGQSFDLDLSGLISGIYIIKVNMGDRMETFRIVKH